MDCSKCQQDKPETEFHKQRDGRFPWCKTCRKDYDKEYHAENRAKIRTQKITLRQRNKAFLLETLAGKSCETCPESDIRTLDFAHKDRATKSFNLADGVRLGYSLRTLTAEIEKCKILCSNCHRKETAEESGTYKSKLNGV